MEQKPMVLIIVALVLLFVGAHANNSNNNNDDQIQITLDDGCQSHCGGVSIPYPFGIGISSISRKKCFLEEQKFNSFKLNCTNNSLLYWGKNIQVTAINITQGKLDIMFYVSKVCYNSSYGSDVTYGNDPYLTISAPSFTISSEDNKFITVGCDTFGYLNSFYDDRNYSTGCVTRCYGGSPNISDGKCLGIGCCEVDIPLGMRNIYLQAASFQNFQSSLPFNNCSYSFVVKNGNYTFSKDHLENLPYKTTPVVFDWSVGGGETCEESKNRRTNVCKRNSTCVDSNAGYGYQCQCIQGYEGNPYLFGCKDIDECKIGNHTCESNCRSKVGSPFYECFCPKGQSGNGTKEHPCRQDNDELLKYAIGASGGFIALFVVVFTLLFLMYYKRKVTKLKEKFFKQNGGLMLLQQLSTREGSSQTVQIFTADELKKATNNYDEKLIIGNGGFGTVFKGFLADNRVVAIKKSKIVDANQTEQFINEVVVLSQINHRNVVKLLGCCLEIEVPLLVYEFVNNGTLFEFLHNGRNTTNSTWETRLRIAAEAAGALTYLHSSASIPIIHRDVKSANILLDENNIAKVSDFGASRLVPLDQDALTTMVQGTIGYLDPEYMQTSQLTDKSDVYSFGVVLVELLTGEKSLSFDRPEDKRSLAAYFLSCLKEDRLFDILQVGLLNEENKQEIEEVVILAAKCLGLKGDERPSMKEVSMELDGIRLMKKDLWINEDKDLEETQTLLPKLTSKIYEHGDSSSHQNTGYDSIRDQVLTVFDDGR